MLEPQDLEAIKRIIDERVKAIVLTSEDRIVTRINREVSDLAAINSAVIAKVSLIPDLQHRLDIVERKLGLA